MSLRNVFGRYLAKPVDYTPDDLAKAGDVWTAEMARRAMRPFSDRTITDLPVFHPVSNSNEG